MTRLLTLWATAAVALAADLSAVQGWSPLHADQYTAKATMATRLVVGRLPMRPRMDRGQRVHAFIRSRVPVYRDGTYRYEDRWVFNNVIAFNG